MDQSLLGNADLKISIFEAMLDLLRRGHAKHGYARAQSPKPKKTAAGDQGGYIVRLDSPNAYHFSIIGAHLKVCNDKDIPFKAECESRRILDQAAIQLGFMRNSREANLDVWGDVASQERIIKVVERAIGILKGETIDIAQPQRKAYR
jgi:hypothetical protein